MRRDCYCSFVEIYHLFATLILLLRAEQTLNLPRLLAELQVPILGLSSLSRANALEATKKALRLAKIRYHPDKVRGLTSRVECMFHAFCSCPPPCSPPVQVLAGDLRAKVQAEEISKILNSWELSKL